MIPPPPPLKTREYVMIPSKMASISNSKWQNHTERPNLSPNNKDIAERAKFHVVCK